MLYSGNGSHNRDFELLNDMNELLGKLSYESWFSVKADIEVKGDYYTIDKENFWMSNIIIRKIDVPIVQMHRNWNAEIVVSVAGGNSYMYRGHGLMNRHFILSAEDGKEVAVVRPEFNWKNFTSRYEIETSDSNADANNPLLLLGLIYAAQSLQQRHV